jgi:TetR/AcrR family transcriptional regulator, repressor for uid operon
MRTVNIEKHQTKKNEILIAAKSCFTEKGIQGTAISKICKVAKISPGHLYHYFENKDDILETIIIQALDNAIEHFTKTLERSDLIVALYGYLEFLYLYGIETGYSLYFDMFSEVTRNPQLAKYLENQSRCMHQLLVSALKTSQEKGEINADLNIDTAAIVLLSLVDGSKTIHSRNLTADRNEILKALHNMMVDYLKHA